MTVEEFNEHRAYLECGICGCCTLSLEHTPNNNGYRPICACGSRRPRPDWPTYLPHAAKKNTRRRAYPEGESLDEVWERYQNRCVSCSATKDQLLFLGIGRHRQHVAEYAEHGHTGPIVPMCIPCHEHATRRQREIKHWLKKLQELYAPESLSPGRAGLPASGLPPDPVSPQGQASARRLEIVPDHHADN